MTPTTLSTLHANEVVVVDAALDPRGRAHVTLGLINMDRSDTFPGRTLSPDQADELAASLVLSAAAVRAGLASTPETEEPASPIDEPGDPQTFPIADYDTLKASKIIKRLPDLTAAQLSAVLTYEQLHRNRKKVRTRIGELLADAQT